MKSTYIAFEGLDGCGKTTQIQLLEKFYKEKGRVVEIVRQPGHTIVGEVIRELVLNEEGNFNETDFLLFLASHIQGILELKERKDEGIVFILDRTFISTMSYQGKNISLSFQDMILLYSRLINHFEVDHLFFLDIDAEVAYKRITTRENKPSDKFEDKGLNFLTELRDNYKSVLDLDQLGIFKKHSIIELGEKTTPEEVLSCIIEILNQENLCDG